MTERKSTRDVGEVIGVCHHTVRKLLREHGIKVRGQTEATKGRPLTEGHKAKLRGKRLYIHPKQGFQKGMTAWNKGMYGENATMWRGGKTRYVYLKARRDVESQLGHPLQEGQVVHHEDINPKNNALCNIRVFNSQSEHCGHHHKLGTFGGLR